MEGNDIRRDAAKTVRALLAGLEDFPLFTGTPSPTAAPVFIPAADANMENCTRCGRHRGRTQVVVGQIVPNAKLCIVGAGPLSDEDKNGRPFQGARGELLDKMLNAIKLARHEVTLLHVVKCYSANSMEASVEEVEACYSYLQNQIREAKPICILAMGQSAGQTLARSNNPLASLRKHRWEWDGIPVFTTYDPAQLLQQAEFKKDAWADLQAVRKQLDLQI